MILQEHGAALRPVAYESKKLTPTEERYTIVVCTDASDRALGAVLLQEHGAALRPVAYESKKLKPTEERYTIAEKECYALVYACLKWRCYLESNLPFTVYTDNSPLVYLMSKPALSRRQARWVELLAPYNFTIEHKAGTTLRMVKGPTRLWLSLHDHAPPGHDKLAVLRYTLSPRCNASSRRRRSA